MGATYTWAPWASSQASASAGMIIIGGIVSIWYPNLMIALTCLGIGILILALETFDKKVKLGFITSNYYFRAFLYAGMAVPCFIQAPTATGGICLGFAIITYLVAAIKGEPHKQTLKKK